jgi:hypothetical protein
MGEIGKGLVFAGGILVLVGFAFIVFGRGNIPLDRLPGDIVYRGKNSTFYFPLATSILVSVALSLLLYVVERLRK